MKIHSLVLSLLLLSLTTLNCPAPVWSLWNTNKAECFLVLPGNDQPSSRLAQSTIMIHLRAFYDIQLPLADSIEKRGTYLILGTPENNSSLMKLVESGVRLNQEIGNEGFHLLTHEDTKSKYIIIYGKTPRALKHGCQELLFYRVLGTTNELHLEAPLSIVMKPEVGYRGIYMLPCWSAHDSFESWQRVLRFNSELTLNRNWFWLDGFPVAGHSGEYTNTALAQHSNVQRLIDLVNDEDMKIYIGGGWFNWHHEKAVGKDPVRGQDYYLAYLNAFKGFHGFYIEPTGEGEEIKSWRSEYETLRELINKVLQQRPDFEWAIAIGKFNNSEYLKLMSEFDPKNVYWWWCWGDPFRDNAMQLYPSILRWHVTRRMAEWHGSVTPPMPNERQLAGITTSYDPGMGFANQWNGWGKLGVDKPRNFHPHTLPYFAHEYYYRERCWNLNLKEEQFVARLQRRLFDSDALKNAATWYWELSQMAYKSFLKYRFPDLDLGEKPNAVRLAEIGASLQELRKRKWTPKMEDTLSRMEEAQAELTKIARDSKP
jgi:hypothetical protein